MPSTIRIITRFILFFFVVLTWLKPDAQTRRISGSIIDSATKIPLPNVTVCIKNLTRCVLANNQGKFSISVDENVKEIAFTATGYKPVFLPVIDKPDQEVKVLMSKSYTTLGEVTVNAQKKKYRNKNNPAVELIRLVIANKSKNGPKAYAYLSYREYEKVSMSIPHPPHLVTDAWPVKKFGFFFQNIDTITVPGKALSAIYLQESLSQNYYQRKPEKKKQIILGKKSVDFGEYVDMRGIKQGLDRMYEDINIYDNTISAFTMQFVSPISDFAPTFYMYYIEDTIVENDVKLVKLYFTPRNPEDLLLQGTLYVTLDGKYAIRKLEMGVNKHTNLNWVRNFKVNQDFELGPLGRYHLATSDMVAFFSAFAKSTGVYGKRTVSVFQLSDSVLTDTVFKGPEVDSLQTNPNLSADILDEERPVQLTPSESKTYSNADSLAKTPSYRRFMDWLTLLSIGYKTLGKFDIGPIGSFYSFNPVEGNRIRVGGRTNTKFSKILYSESYVAYGFKDEKWKYFLSGTYSLNYHSIYKYPFNYIQASYMHDTRNPGQEDLFAQGNAFLSSFTRGYNSKWLYNDIFRLSYVKELRNHLSYDIGIKYWKQDPADSLYYIYRKPDAKFDTAQSITIGELSFTLRWAPHEQFFENKVGRVRILNKYPVFTLQYAKGIKGFLGGEYNYDAFHLGVEKRFYVAPIGFTDITLDAGYLAGVLPFPLLTIPPANQSYFYSYFAYNLMNIQEFVNDKYVGMNVEHYFNGFFFNKIPLLKKLRMREVVAAKILFGGLRDENNPDKNPNQMLFPLVNGQLSTFAMTNVPYIEASVGIYNIFSIIRLDLVKRFTYLDHPNISGLGLRFSTNFNF